MFHFLFSIFFHAKKENKRKNIGPAVTAYLLAHMININKHIIRSEINDRMD